MYIKQNGHQPVSLMQYDCPTRIAPWETSFTLSTYDLVCALLDALRIDYPSMLVERNILQLQGLHHRLCGELPRIDYSRIPSLAFTAIDQPNDNPYIFEEDEYARIMQHGARLQDICLNNFGIQRMETEMVALLTQGYSPYIYTRDKPIDDDETDCYGFEKLSPVINIMHDENTFAWSGYLGEKFNGRHFAETDRDLEQVFEGVVLAGSCMRILYLINKHITANARQNGEEMMKLHFGYVSTIL